MTDWNYADVWETVADVKPDAIVVTQGERHVSWQRIDRGVDGVARFLLDQGVGQQDKVAVYLYNCPEYLQACFAAIKVGLVPVNTNYRYGDDELSYLWNNADSVAVVFHGTFVGRIERIRERVPDVRSWLWVDDGSGPCPDWAIPYEEAAKSATAPRQRPVGPQRGRPPHDLHRRDHRHAQGGMRRQDDLFVRLIAAGVRQYPLDGGIDAVRQSIVANPDATTLLPACPLMHGTGWFTTNMCLAEGGRIVLLAGPQIRPGRAVGHGRARESERPGHSRRPLLTPSGGCAERPARALGPELPHGHRLFGGHVERVGEERVAAASPRHAAGGRVQLVGGPGHGDVGVGRG